MTWVFLILIVQQYIVTCQGLTHDVTHHCEMLDSLPGLLQVTKQMFGPRGGREAHTVLTYNSLYKRVAGISHAVMMHRQQSSLLIITTKRIDVPADCLQYTVEEKRHH